LQEKQVGLAEQLQSFQLRAKRLEELRQLLDVGRVASLLNIPLVKQAALGRVLPQFREAAFKATRDLQDRAAAYRSLVTALVSRLAPHVSQGKLWRQAREQAAKELPDAELRKQWMQDVKQWPEAMQAAMTFKEYATGARMMQALRIFDDLVLAEMDKAPTAAVDLLSSELRAATQAGKKPQAAVFSALAKLFGVNGFTRLQKAAEALAAHGFGGPDADPQQLEAAISALSREERAALLKGAEMLAPVWRQVTGELAVPQVERELRPELRQVRWEDLSRDELKALAEQEGIGGGWHGPVSLWTKGELIEGIKAKYGLGKDDRLVPESLIRSLPRWKVLGKEAMERTIEAPAAVPAEVRLAGPEFVVAQLLTNLPSRRASELFMEGLQAVDPSRSRLAVLHTLSRLSDELRSKATAGYNPAQFLSRLQLLATKARVAISKHPSLPAAQLYDLPEVREYLDYLRSIQRLSERVAGGSLALKLPEPD